MRYSIKILPLALAIILDKIIEINSFLAVIVIFLSLSVFDDFILMAVRRKVF